MIRVINKWPGSFKFEYEWPEGLGLRFDLTIIDPDGDEDKRVIEWIASKSYNFRTAMTTVAELVEELPHWRAVVTGDNEVVVGPVEPDYAYNIEVSVIDER